MQVNSTLFFLFFRFTGVWLILLFMGSVQAVAGDQTEDFVKLVEQSKQLSDQGQLKEARLILVEALDAAEDQPVDEDNLFVACQQLASVHFAEENFKAARDCLNRMLEIGEKTDDYAYQLTSIQQLGELYYSIGDYPKSIEYLTQSCKLAEEKGDHEGVVYGLVHLSRTHHRMDETKLAYQVIMDAQYKSRFLNDSTLLGDVLFQYAMVLKERGDDHRSIAKLLEALHIFEKEQAWQRMITTLMSLGKQYMEMDHPEKAVPYWQRCLQYQSLIAKTDLADILYQTGLTAFALGQDELAIQHLKQGLDTCEYYRLKNTCKQVHFQLYRIYEQQKSFDLALQHLEKSIKLEDEIAKEQKVHQLAELQFKYDQEKSEKEIHALQLRQNKIVLLGSVVLFSLIFVLLFYTWRVRVRISNRLTTKNQEIQQHNVKLGESNEVLKQFAYVAAHDLKEPLRSISGFISLLERKYGNQFSTEAKEYMGFVTHGAVRMNSLLGDLLEYSRISAEAPENVSSDIEEIVEAVKKEIKSQINKTDARISCASSMPKVNISRLHLFQLLQNLISNGIKFNEGIPEIKISAIEEKDDVIVCVSDNGIGIDEEFSHKVFNLFHQLKKSTENYTGTGIGLTICKNIIDKYDGKIWFESKGQKGTNFFMSIPKMRTIKAKPGIAVNEKGKNRKTGVLN